MCVILYLKKRRRREYVILLIFIFKKKENMCFLYNILCNFLCLNFECNIIYWVLVYIVIFDWIIVIRLYISVDCV